MLFAKIFLCIIIAGVAIDAILKLITHYKVKHLAIGQIYKPRIDRFQTTYIIKELIDGVVIYQLCGTNRVYDMPKENFVIVFKQIN